MFRISFYQDEKYEVWRRESSADEWISVYQGSLADCEAYVRLCQNETVDFAG